MPISVGSLPFDLCFFYLGVVARRSKWLLEPDKDKEGEEETRTEGQLVNVCA